MGVRIRPLDPSARGELELVAERMRKTLVEVLGEERGTALYTLDWLRERVRFHLDSEQCTGQVFVAEAEDGRVAGHTIVRVEREESGEEIGLFSTFYVEPESRRQGVATDLLARGEAWMRERGMTVAVTNTSDANAKLIELLQLNGYRIVLTTSEMVRLARDLG